MLKVQKKSRKNWSIWPRDRLWHVWRKLGHDDKTRKVVDSALGNRDTIEFLCHDLKSYICDPCALWEGIGRRLLKSCHD